MLAAESYAARVDAVLTQRTRLRGAEPPGDPFAGLPADHPILRSDPRRPLEPNLQIIASYLAPADVLIDVGGGGGRYSLPLALRCREVINVDPSPSMLAAFEANARQAQISNARAIHGSWPMDDPPHGSIALVAHVTYLTRDIVPFVRGLEQVASRRVAMVVGNPPAPARSPETHSFVFGEASAVVPGHVELIDVLRGDGHRAGGTDAAGPSDATDAGDRHARGGSQRRAGAAQDQSMGTLATPTGRRRARAQNSRAPNR